MLASIKKKKQVTFMFKRFQEDILFSCCKTFYVHEGLENLNLPNLCNVLLISV